MLLKLNILYDWHGVRYHNIKNVHFFRICQTKSMKRIYKILKGILNYGRNYSFAKKTNSCKIFKKITSLWLNKMAIVASLTKY